MKPTVEFSLKEATKHVISYYSFLGKLDERDDVFLSLAGFLLGRQIAKKRLDAVKKIKYPIKHLFHGVQISNEAQQISTDQIRLYSRRRHKPKRLSIARVP